MSEITSNQNLKAHYSTEVKVQRPQRPIAAPPETLPKNFAFNDKEANNRIKAIDKDIYLDSKKEEKKQGMNFVKIFGLGVVGLLALLGLKRIFK
jgi:hypothetical protein